jgi:hypothetical protein
MGNHPTKVQGKWEHKVDTTQRKNKNEQSTQTRLKPYAKRTHGYEMSVNNNQEDLRWKNCHL